MPVVCLPKGLPKCEGGSRDPERIVSTASPTVRCPLLQSAISAPRARAIIFLLAAQELLHGLQPRQGARAFHSALRTARGDTTAPLTARS
jgi:hypothetical protein